MLPIFSIRRKILKRNVDIAWVRSKFDLSFERQQSKFHKICFLLIFSISSYICIIPRLMSFAKLSGNFLQLFSCDFFKYPSLLKAHPFEAYNSRIRIKLPVPFINITRYFLVPYLVTMNLLAIFYRNFMSSSRRDCKAHPDQTHQSYLLRRNCREHLQGRNLQFRPWHLRSHSLLLSNLTLSIQLCPTTMGNNNCYFSLVWKTWTYLQTLSMY